LREEIVINQTAALRQLLADEAFIHLPVAYDALGGRLIESTGFKSAYVGGFVTGAPAEPASASPVTDDSSSIPIRRGNQMRCSTSLQGCRPGLGYML
jgi:hypothetical protein